MTDFNKILDKAKEIEEKIKDSQEKIKQIKVEGSSGGGIVKVILNGNSEIEKIDISELSYFDIASDLDIGKIDPNYLFDVLSKTNLINTDALFVSCTALPVMSIINDLEKKIGKVVLSSNQTLIWDTFKKINFKNEVEGYGELFNN